MLQYKCPCGTSILLGMAAAKLVLQGHFFVSVCYLLVMGYSMSFT